MFAVVVAAFARRLKRDRRVRRCCAAKKRNRGNRERRPRHCDGSYHFVIAVWSAKAAESARVKYWEIITDGLSKAGWSWGCVAAIDANGQTVWIADAHRGDGKR